MNYFTEFDRYIDIWLIVSMFCDKKKKKDYCFLFFKVDVRR